MYVNYAELYVIVPISTISYNGIGPEPGFYRSRGHFWAKNGQKMPKNRCGRGWKALYIGLIKGFLPIFGHFWAIFSGFRAHFSGMTGVGGPTPLNPGVYGGSTGVLRDNQAPSGPWDDPGEPSESSHL
jgi:hypothetical protein